MKTRHAFTAFLVLGLMVAVGIPRPLSAGELTGSTRLVHPNPFTTSTTFELSMPQPGRVRIIVYDLLGKEVQVLKNNEEYGIGTHPIFWDGNDKTGAPVTPGMYICVLFSEGIAVKSVKVVKVKG